MNMIRAGSPRLFPWLLLVALIVGSCGPKAWPAVTTAVPPATRANTVKEPPGIPGATSAVAAVRRTMEAIASQEMQEQVASMEPAARPSENPPRR